MNSEELRDQLGASAADELHDQPHHERDREHDHQRDQAEDDQPLRALGSADQGVHDRSVDPSGHGCPRIDQTIFAGDPKRKGNCVAACVATLLEVPLHEVPHFLEHGITWGDADETGAASTGNAWWAMLLGYLAGRGLWVEELPDLDSALPGERVLIAGMSPRGVLHQVIYADGRLWHDPHPSRAGVLDVREVLAVRPLPGFDHTPTTDDETEEPR